MSVNANNMDIDVKHKHGAYIALIIGAIKQIMRDPNEYAR